MNHKFAVVLFVTIFYNGVIYASPVNEYNAEGILPEEKPPTVSPVSVDHINKKVEPTPAPAADHTAPVTRNSTIPLHQPETPTVKTETAHTSSNATVAVHDADGKNATHDSKNVTSAVDNKNASSVITGKNTTQPINGKNATAPAVVPSTPVPSTHPSQNPTTTEPTIKPTTAANTTNATATTTTTMKMTNITVDVTTVAPNTTTSDKIVVVHNVPTPAHENHFDGPSFIGGIVLTIGLTAIGFIAFKYYKSGKIDMNYRTL